MKKSEGECIHDPNSKETSLIKLPKRYLMNPEILDYFCPMCHTVHRYKKEGTTLVLITDSKE